MEEVLVCSAVQCSVVQCSAVQCTAVQCSAVTGSSTPALTNRGKSGKRKFTETITIDRSSSDSSDREESPEEMEKRLARMLEMKFKRRRGPNSSN